VVSSHQEGSRFQLIPTIAWPSCYTCGLDGTSLRQFSAFKPLTLSCLPAIVQNRQARLSSIPFCVFYSICGGTNREVVTWPVPAPSIPSS
jgi:hypothetical protein